MVFSMRPTKFCDLSLIYIDLSNRFISFLQLMGAGVNIIEGLV